MPTNRMLHLAAAQPHPLAGAFANICAIVHNCIHWGNCGVQVLGVQEHRMGS